jgi:hypothetical protein
VLTPLGDAFIIVSRSERVLDDAAAFCSKGSSPPAAPAAQRTLQRAPKAD